MLRSILRVFPFIFVFNCSAADISIDPPTGINNKNRYVSSDYDRKEYRITRKDITHGNALINITQAKRIRNYRENTSPSVCRIWIKISSNGKTTFSRYYNDIDPVGFAYGTHIAELPVMGWLPIVKNGDYDGRLLLVSKDGSTLEYPGGFYFLSPDKRYLFSEYITDGHSLIVIDLKTGKIVYNDKNQPYTLANYSDGNDIYMTMADDNNAEIHGITYRYDYAKHLLVRVNKDKSSIVGLKDYPYAYDPRLQPDCEQGVRLP